MKTSADNVKAEFEQNKYVKISQAIVPSVINFIDSYIHFFLYRYEKILEHLPAYYDTNEHGEILDESAYEGHIAKDSFSKYGDMFSDFLLLDMKENIGSAVGLELVPTYAYFRIYTDGNELKKHTDRPSCEISTTLCIGYEGESWPIFIEGTPIYQEPGDMIIYRGCEVEHWREAFKGKRHIQMFLHYNDKNGPNGEDNLYDGRPFLGMPAWTKNPDDKFKMLNRIALLNQHTLQEAQ